MLQRNISLMFIGLYGMADCICDGHSFLILGTEWLVMTAAAGIGFATFTHIMTSCHVRVTILEKFFKSVLHNKLLFKNVFRGGMCYLSLDVCRFCCIKSSLQISYMLLWNTKS